MTIRNLDPKTLGQAEDWEGNNAAFTCPVCEKVFIVSDHMHAGPAGENGYRECPGCGQSIGRVSGGKKSGGTASLEWQEPI